MTGDHTHKNLHTAQLCCMPSPLHSHNMLSAGERSRQQADRCHTPIKDKKYGSKGIFAVPTPWLMTPVKKGIVAIAPKSKLPFSPHVHVRVQNAHTSCYTSGINLTCANVFSWGQDWSAMQRSPSSCNAKDTLNLPPENEGIAEGRPGRSAVLKPGSSVGTANPTVTSEVLQRHIYHGGRFPEQHRSGHTSAAGCGSFSISLKIAEASRGLHKKRSPGAGGIVNTGGGCGMQSS